uniref:Uncharacterized protein n=1 Tax=Chenopodium quinoa TaxID=63459 RepID=A0A803N1A4_CHEQI
MGVTMAALLPTVKFNFLPKIPSSSNSSIKRVVGLKPVFCSAVQEVEQQCSLLDTTLLGGGSGVSERLEIFVKD